MVSKQIVELVKALQERGYENRLSWTETENENAYQTTIGSATLRIREEDIAFEQRAPDYYLEILREGRVLESVSDSELANYLRDSFQTMAEIYTNARAKARGIDEIVGDVLKHLGVSQPAPKPSDDGLDEEEIPF